MTSLQKILFVEDDPDIQMVAQLALEAVGGYTVQMCSSGKEALAVAEQFAPDLILLDVMMPGMDGPTTLMELRKKPSLTHTPVVFMTARVQRHEIEQYLAMGAADVISKPFDPMTLSAQVADIWVKANETRS
ncbi:MAG: response regulator [Chloroflexus sp.]|uniref:response regulator n=1 Tax=Chloroflexus sp. Y-396-1 TaxID=867845 RepID=UPI00048C7533|nr:response regulator [Chloroflexus sp. Y-396-1]MBO9313157.1 response regulator [Chloroflexus sp.]MBO9318618.1 response regulator [Chloroflexus sp.]MBO9374293.1 response regulator [Chloroflexus sp.]